MIVSRKKTTSMFVASSIVVALLSLASPLVRHRAQERNRSVTTARPSAEPAQTAEPSMRIALSTDTRAATISTSAKLLNASDLISEPQPLEVSRVRVESRMLSPTQPANENIEIVVARALARDDADRMVD